MKARTKTSDWHLDPQGQHTFDAFAATERSPAADRSPIPLARFLDYAAWFIEQALLDVDTRLVRSLTHSSRHFDLELDDGERVRATSVLCAPGVRYFRNIPREYVRGLSDALWCHSTDIRDVKPFAGKRCLIVGGRQSAYELGTLLERDAGADVTIVHRHPAPAFTESDWSWVAADLQAAEEMPGWFARRDASVREAIRQRFWREGRLKLEPWLHRRASARAVSRAVPARPHRLHRRIPIARRPHAEHVGAGTLFRGPGCGSRLRAVHGFPGGVSFAGRTIVAAIDG